MSDESERRSKGQQAFALDDISSRLNADLESIARRVRRQGTVVSTRELLQETYFNLVKAKHRTPESRSGFLRVAARAMRHVLYDLARRAKADKRGGGAPQVGYACEEFGSRLSGREFEVLEFLDSAFAHDSRMLSVVQLKVFGGLTNQETAEALDCSVRTINSDWRFASARLEGMLSDL